jgi:hypothetical protein
MELVTKTTATLFDELGREVTSVSRTVRAHVGGNRRFFQSEGAPVAVANAETAVVNAVRALDHTEVPADAQ